MDVSRVLLDVMVPLPPSLNATYYGKSGGGIGKRQAVVDYQSLVVYSILDSNIGFEIPPLTKLQLTIVFYMTSRQMGQRDCDNGIKSLQDAVFMASRCPANDAMVHDLRASKVLCGPEGSRASVLLETEEVAS